MKAMKHILILAMLAVLGAAVLVGCNEGPKYPPQSEVEKTNQDRLSAIDNDPKMSAADKERMKAVLSSRQPPKGR